MVDAVVWVARALLAGVLGAGGAVGIATPLPELANIFTWTSGASPAFVRGAAVAALVAAVVLVLPPRNRIAAVASRASAVAVALGLTVAMFVHLDRDEMTAFRMSVVLVGMAAFVAANRSSVARRELSAQRSTR